MLKSSRRRLVGGLALAVALVGLATPMANAETDLGDLFVTPTTGGVNGFINMDTHAPCPEGTNKVKVSINGAGITDTSANNLNGVTFYSATVPNASGGFGIQAAVPLKDIFQAYAIVAPNGAYTINLRCQSSDGGIIYGDFLAVINMVASATPFEGTYTWQQPTSDGEVTSTALSVGTPDPIKSGTATSLTATVTPSGAVGSVQFKRGTTSIGSPIAVAGGTATLDSTVLPAGTQSLTAVFTPTDPNAFLPSTSAVRSYVVAGPASVTGTKRVGSTISCTSVATATATKAFVWFRGSSVSSITASSFKLPASWYGATVKCAVKTTKNAVTVTQISPTSTTKVAAGVAPVATTKPSIIGTLRVGRTLTCAKGTWTNSPSSYKWQWYRGTTALSGKTYSTYKTVSTDKGKYLKCRVTAIKAGYLNGVAYSALKKIT